MAGARIIQQLLRRNLQHQAAFPNSDYGLTAISAESSICIRRMEEDARRESVLAKLPILQPNFKPVGVSQSQKNKFQELHRRRLQIKSKFKSKKKPKGNKEFEEKDLKAKGFEDQVADLVSEGSNVNERDDAKDDVPLVFKKRKLHWGLDTKERWERKSNM